VATSSSTRRVRQSGADPKPPQTAAVKRRGGERCGNVGTMIPAGKVERGERQQTGSEVSKEDDVKTGGDPSSGISSGDTGTVRDGIRHGGGAKLDQAFVPNVRTCSPMSRDRPQAAPTARARLPKRNAGAEQPVVVTKAL
jgi:hypothetical protein